MKPRWYASILVVLCLAGLLAMAGARGAAAQEPGVDLGVYADNFILEQVDNYFLFVANYGAADAFGVRVEIEFGPDFYEYETQDPAALPGSQLPSGGSLTKDPNNPAVWIWEIPQLPAQSSHTLNLQRPFFGIANPFVDFAGVAVVAVATVSSDSVEDETKLENNRVETWLYFDTTESLLFPGPFSVEATVDNHLPQPGQEIVFEISAFFESYMRGGVLVTGDILSDTVVQVQLTPGLTYSEESYSTRKLTLAGNADPDVNKSTYTHSHADNAGRWDIGPFEPGSFHLELTATVDADAGGEEQCLTAEISGRPDEPLGEGGGDRSLDNIARVCVQPRQPDTAAPAVLSDGEVSLFTWYDCVGQTDYPCDSANNANGDGLEVVVLPGTAASNTATPEMLLQPKDIVVNVRDPHIIEDSNMVKSVVWSTGLAGKSIPGVQIALNTHLGPQTWSDGKTAVSLTGPGALKSTFFIYNTEYPLWDIPVNGSLSDLDTSLYLGSLSVNFLPFRIEFSQLGTYVLQYSNSALHDPDGKEDPNDIADDTLYSDTETYTFHVGPMADLAVDSVWETAQGVTVAVVNNGPDPSPGGQVMLNTGESCDFDHVHPHSEAATCTVAGAQLAGTAVIGTIEDNVKYGVCIDTRDGSDYVAHVHGDEEEEETHEEDCILSFTEWHSGDMYDPYPGNNVVRGPASSAPIPGGVNAQFASTTTSVTIRAHRVNWEPLEELYGWKVSHYEVERLGLTSNRWQPIAHVAAPPYDDTDEERGSSPRYRVRAVNVAGQEGPWGETGVSGTSGLPRLTLSLDPATIAEPDGQATVTARLNKASGQDVPITVSAALASGNDTEDQPSFTLSDNKQLMIPAGMLESTGAVTISANADDDGLNEQVRVSAVAAYVQSNIPAVTLTIQDDDAPGLVLSDPNGVTVREGGESTYTVALNAQPSGNVHVRLYRGNNDITVDTDTGAGGVQDTLVFTPDNWNTARTVTVGGVEDDDAADETTTIRHSILDSPSAREYRSVADVTLNVTVTDNDTGRIGVKVEPLTLNVTEGQSGKTYRVSLGTRPSGNVYITTAIVPAEPGESGVRVSPATIVLNSNNWGPGRTVTVSAVRDQDGADEMGTTIAHAIDTERTTATEYVTWYEHPANDVDSVTVNVSDVDKPGVQVSPETLRINEGRSGSYSVKLNTQPAEGETVTITVRSDDADVTVSPDKLTFTSTNWSRNQRVTVNAKTDVDAADDTTMLRHTMSSTDSASAYNGPSDVTVTVTVTDPDRPGVTIGPLSPTPVKEAGRWIEETETVDGEERSAGRMRMTEAHPSFYTVRLDTKPTGNVVIDLDTPHQDKVTVYPTSLTFTPDRLSWTVTVHARDDADKDDEKATITHKVNAASSADEYDTVSVRSLDVTVDDNDDPGVTLLVSELMEVSEGGTAEYRVVLDTQADGVIVIGVESSKPGKVSVEPEFLWFSGIQLQHGRTWPDWDKPQTITVTALDDGDGKEETVTLIHKVADANAHGWDVPIGAKVGEVIVTVRDAD